MNGGGRIARLASGAIALACAVTMLSATGAGATQPSTAAPVVAPHMVVGGANSALPYPGAPRLTSLVAFARAWAVNGPWYLYGGGHGKTPGPTNGRFDCSGWVRYAYWAAFGINLTGTANQMIHSGKFVRTTHPVPGDVVAFNWEGGTAHVDHIGIYLGGKAPDGRPAMVDTPHDGVRLGVHGFGFGLIGYYHYVGATAADSGALVRATSTTISMPSTADKNQLVTVRGRVAAGVARITTGAVQVYLDAGAGWKTLTKANLDKDGSYALSYRATGVPTRMYVRYLGSAYATASSSPTVTLGVTVRSTATTIALPSTADKGQTVAVTGRVTGSWQTAGAAMRLYVRTHGTTPWRLGSADVKTDANGNYRFVYTATGQPTDVTVRFIGRPYARVSDSPIRILSVTVRNTAITASVTAHTTEDDGDLVTVSGAVSGSPETAGAIVRLNVRVGGGPWQAIATTKATSTGAFSVSTTVPAGTTIDLQTVFAGTAYARASQSPVLTVTAAPPPTSPPESSDTDSGSTETTTTPDPTPGTDSESTTASPPADGE